MNIALDIDGTITSAPELFSLISKAVKASGGHVYVLSYRGDNEREDTVQELRHLEIKYDGLFLYEPMPELDALQWKAKLAEDLSIDVVFDDSPEILATLPPKIKRMWLCAAEHYDLSQFQ